VVAHAALDLADLGAVGLDLRCGRTDLRAGFVHQLLPGLVLLRELLRRVLDLMMLTTTAQASFGEPKDISTVHCCAALGWGRDGMRRQWWRPHLVQDLVVLVDLALAGLDLLAQLGQLFFSALKLRPNQVALHFADLLHRVVPHAGLAKRRKAQLA
jgi:hypothetical protein